MATPPAQPTNFAFVLPVWPQLGRDAIHAERTALRTPDVAAFFARRTSEKLLKHVWRFADIGDAGDRTFADLTVDPRFARLAGSGRTTALTAIRLTGNKAVHAGGVRPEEAVKAVKHLFDILSWAIARYSAHPEAAPTQPFNEQWLQPNVGKRPAQATPPAELKKLVTQLDAKDKELSEQALLLNESEQKLLDQQEAHAREKALFAQRAAQTEEEHAQVRRALEEELTRLRTQLMEQQRALAKPQAPLAAPTISEAETRRDIIDPMLARAGFTVGTNLQTEYAVSGMPTASGKGSVDYVLLGGDGVPLALVEAKRFSRSFNDGETQAKLYADALEAKFKRRPIIFLTNGYHIQLIDTDGSTRAVEGYPNADQLYAMIYRRERQQPLAQQIIDAEIAGRDYQMRMIRAVTERFEEEGCRRALLVMATGTGKTRVAIAIAKLLRKAKWAKKVLFLADRQALVEQAHDNFTEHYSSSNPVNLLATPEGIGDVYISTYQTMMRLISDDGEEPAKFNPFDFDLIFIDEAHRSIYHRYRRILEYFDARTVGLTATPKSDIHHDTYALFHIDGKEPTGSYSLEEAIADGHLVPYKVFKAESLFLRAGMRYEELSDEERASWDAQDWGVDEEGNALPPPDGVSAAEVNRVLYNRDTIRKVLGNLVESGQKVAGDQLGKTIIFARTQQHADLIKEEFDTHFPMYAGDGARVITHSSSYASSAIRNFKVPWGNPRVAISVDMLDTGIDVPEVMNLVFFKPVYSPTKFWQMVGRGTRLWEGKEYFTLFDYCGNVEMFTDRPETDDSGTQPVTLSEKLFAARAQLLVRLDKSDAPLRKRLCEHLHALVCSVPEGNILIRPENRPVLRAFRSRQQWDQLAEAEEVIEHLAHLPFHAVVKEKESAKLVDLLILQLQLGLVEASGTFLKNRQRLEQVANDLLGVELVQVQKHAALLERVLDPSWWEGVTVADLEEVRVVVRELAEFIPRSQRNIVVVDFEDEITDLEEVELNPAGAAIGVHESRIEAQLRNYLESKKDAVALQKLRRALPLTPQDVEELDALVDEAGKVAAPEDFERYRTQLKEGGSPGLIRRLIGLEPEAIRAVFADYLEGSTLNANQIGFTRTLVDVICNQGGIEVADLFQPPFNNYQVSELFEQAQLLDITQRIDQINSSAKVG